MTAPLTKEEAQRLYEESSVALDRAKVVVKEAYRAYGKALEDLKQFPSNAVTGGEWDFEASMMYDIRDGCELLIKHAHYGGDPDKFMAGLEKIDRWRPTIAWILARFERTPRYS